MFTVQCEPSLRGTVHFVQSDEFDFMIALYEKALEANHDTDCGKVTERLYWVEIYCTEGEFEEVLQSARREANTAAMQEAEVTSLKHRPLMRSISGSEQAH